MLTSSEQNSALCWRRVSTVLPILCDMISCNRSRGLTALLLVLSALSWQPGFACLDAGLPLAGTIAQRRRRYLCTLFQTLERDPFWLKHRAHISLSPRNSSRDRIEVLGVILDVPMIFPIILTHLHCMQRATGPGNCLSYYGTEWVTPAATPAVLAQ